MTVKATYFPLRFGMHILQNAQKARLVNRYMQHMGQQKPARTKIGHKAQSVIYITVTKRFNTAPDWCDKRYEEIICRHWETDRAAIATASTDYGGHCAQ
jgi:hypothetical protein